MKRKNDIAQIEAELKDMKIELPSTEELQAAYDKVSYRERLRNSIISTTNILIVVAALAILVAMLFLPVLRMDRQLQSSRGVQHIS